MVWLLATFCVAQESDPEDAKTGFSFVIGARGDGGGNVAQVVVEKVAPPEKKRGVFLVAKATAPVATGIAVRFEQIEAKALDEIPAAVKAFAKASSIQMRRLALYAPGDPVPRLMADEALATAPGEWTLKRVLLADRPSAPECKLVWNKGVPRLAFARGKFLEFTELLAARGKP